jgi:hypothetical protein
MSKSLTFTGVLLDVAEIGVAIDDKPIVPFATSQWTVVECGRAGRADTPA